MVVGLEVTCPGVRSLADTYASWCAGVQTYIAWADDSHLPNILIVWSGRPVRAGG